MLGALQEALVEVILAEDPAAALAEHATHPELAPWLATIDPAGLALTRLLVHKLRFERILAGDRELAERFAEDPGAFTAAFAEYVRREPPTVVFPEEEAARFRSYLPPTATC